MNRTLVALSLATAVSLGACSSTHPKSHAADGIDTSGLHAAGTSGGALTDPSAPPSTAPPTAAVPDACTLITRAEAKKLLGIPLQPGDDTRADAADGVASCNYNAPVTGPSGQLGVYAQIGEPDALKTDRNLGHKFRTIAGIGDQTLEEPENGSIFTRKGDLWVFINVPISTPASVLVTAARIAAARL